MTIEKKTNKYLKITLITLVSLLIYFIGILMVEIIYNSSIEYLW